LLDRVAASAWPVSSIVIKVAPLSCRRGSQGAIMFKRRATGQRIFPSEPAAHSLRSPVPEGSTATSSAAELAYLDIDGAPHEGEQTLMISASPSNPLAVPSFAKAGFLFRRLSIKR
jgi:hypothetical protein